MDDSGTYDYPTGTASLYIDVRVPTRGCSRPLSARGSPTSRRYGDVTRSM
jgi:hypothetical protein